MNDGFCKLVSDHLIRKDIRDERLRMVRDIVIGLAAFIALLIAVGWPTGANAALVFKHPQGSNGQPVSLRLMDTPCSNEKVLKYIKTNVQERFVPKFKNAVLHWAGKDWASCWVEYDGNVYSYDEEGEPFNPPMGVPFKLFRDDSV